MSDNFQKQVRSEVEKYLKAHCLSPYGGWRVYIKTAIILFWLATSYQLLVFGNFGIILSFTLAVNLGLSFACLHLNLLHESAHFSFHPDKETNKSLSCIADALGISAFIWSFRHNHLHHPNTNIIGVDTDLNLSVLARFSPYHQWLSHYRLQHIYLWVLYAFQTLNMIVQNIFEMISKKKDGHDIPKPSTKELFIFWLGKINFIILFFLTPLYVHGLKKTLVFFCIFIAVSGLAASIIFVLGHFVQGTQFFDEDTAFDSQKFFEQQLASTAGFCHNNPFISWYSGGLNFQIEHHLFPRISHIHYPAIARIVKRLCKEHHIQYHYFPTLRVALKSHYLFLKDLGKKPHANQAL